MEIPIGPRHALSREWAVLISAEGVRACLAAWEQPCEAEVPDARRRFEVLWSFEPSSSPTRWPSRPNCSRRSIPTWPPRCDRRARPAAADLDPAPALRYGGAVTHRMVGYLGRLLVAPGDAGPHVQP